MEDKPTLAQVIFPKENAKKHDYFAEHILTADSIEDIEKALFVLKLRTEPSFVATVLEIVFSNLVILDLDLVLGVREHKSGSIPVDNADFAQKCREQIGAMAIEVFFHAVFDKDPDAFWNYIKLSCNWSSLVEYQKAPTDFTPGELDTFLHYFAKCSEATKKDCKGKIRKFLNMCWIIRPRPPRHSSKRATDTLASGFPAGQFEAENFLLWRLSQTECMKNAWNIAYQRHIDI